MKRSDITPEIIRLSKEIAKYWRMEIYEGCWVRVANKTRMVIGVQDEFYYTQDSFNWGHPQWTIKAGFPIPSISDCLEKLMELGIDSYEWVALKNGRWEVFTYENDVCVHRKASSFHEALLSALLEVLRGGEG